MLLSAGGAAAVRPKCQCRPSEILVAATVVLKHFLQPFTHLTTLSRILIK